MLPVLAASVLSFLRVKSPSSSHVRPPNQPVSPPPLTANSTTKAREMNQTLTYVVTLMILSSCSTVPHDEHVQEPEGSTGFDRRTWAAETMEAFGYKPDQYEAGAGMATVDDFSAPRIVGGPSGYSMISVDGQEVSRKGADPEIDYVPYAWISAGLHLLEFELRSEEAQKDRPKQIALNVE
ncbi:MAG: hypothetical protein ACI8X5_000463 [Planctomycetota bacterium]